ncbi:hypothetical protein D8B26_003817 [Coccidioides posadasii str. Silveira]|uniref:Uncharacterized protein n=3 Tax=Coccidioides posadasii TaxID=199306 RepID=E9D906_COCPS|nr:RNA recognition motif containing protein [Coccidioides posadasii C735 delta SOWgp]EER29614.1 RNA recognition motif containing protein [Coccidioides posadasii C735 delta SOWgp]EFW17040.1 conserved hypothetical protein [Coccidioides posadasii str. Silveira]KMM69954.1 hypothetical protein CPAG_06266 [Coccidioides posadasii RMSCC 3488]QVM09153.1 hypothetical protein D8B26_003817 [Coccidioides posadasii str. Silveira]|eukprot:XP_003071759.1 RNA recognition motif containing protein [Coccidioides posadasii C735 delta SOWgp]
MAQVNEGNEPGPRTPRPNVNRRWQNSPNWRSKDSAEQQTEQRGSGSRWERDSRPPQPSFNRTNPSHRDSNREQPTNAARPSNRGSENSANVLVAAPDVPASFAEGRRLYVGNMPYMAKKEDVEALFNSATKHGEGYYQIERIDISIDPFTGRNPSFCFVELASKEQATHAMEELDGRDMLGRPVKIKPGIPKSPKPQFGRRDPSSKEDERPRPFIFDRWGRDDASSHWYGVADEGRRLFVGGLPRMPNQATADYEIQKLFYGFKIEAISKVISPHPSKRSQPGNHYFLFVDLESAEEADRAIKTLGGVSAVWGSPLHINKARGNSQKPAERDKWDEGKPGSTGRQNCEEGNSARSQNWRTPVQPEDKPDTTTTTNITTTPDTLS